MTQRISFQILLTVCLTLFFQNTVQAEEWKTLESNYFTFYYLNHEDLKKINKSIDFSDGSGNFLRFLGGSSKSKPALGKELAAKTDALCEKVQLILGMKKELKVKVRIYPDKDALQDAFFQTYKKETNLRSWYLFEYNTIYVNARDLFSGMFAHEVAHAVIDNFLVARPPRETAEILAQYVDKHLYEKAKTY
ncbi:MAG: hypothetical protein RBR67_04385 [Desulfobacterium sp.]|nr:hypothetical protein [Desulfobacterium sp.]